MDMLQMWTSLGSCLAKLLHQTADECYMMFKAGGKDTLSQYMQIKETRELV